MEDLKNSSAPTVAPSANEGNLTAEEEEFITITGFLRAGKISGGLNASEEEDFNAQEQGAFNRLNGDGGFGILKKSSKSASTKSSKSSKSSQSATSGSSNDDSDSTASPAPTSSTSAPSKTPTAAYSKSSKSSKSASKSSKSSKSSRAPTGTSAPSSGETGSGDGGGGGGGSTSKSSKSSKKSGSGDGGGGDNGDGGVILADYCGTDADDALKCGTPCPGGQNDTCPEGEYCYAAIPCGGPPSDGPTPDDHYKQCVERGSNYVCSSAQDYGKDGRWATMNTALRCPLAAVKKYGFVDSSLMSEEMCECESTLTTWFFYDLGIIDSLGPVDCECHACEVETPIGLRAGFAYQCDVPIIGECLSIDCNARCNGEGPALTLPPLPPGRISRPPTTQEPTSSPLTPRPTSAPSDRPTLPPNPPPVQPPTNGDSSGAPRTMGMPHDGFTTLILVLTTYFMGQVIR